MQNVIANSTIQGKTLFVKESVFLGFCQILKDVSNPFQNSTQESIDYLRNFVAAKALEGIKLRD